ncbi:MAG: lipopolysaccharide heptosyltransferase family protein [Alphaproteobacteria bacterium]|nr:lipopolysaccharide heptosyltransferase family protein [Alphaproteobacteria bacterium]
MKILAIRHGALGDVIQALGPFQAIRRHHADAHLVALTGMPFAELLRASGWFQEVWVDGRPPLWRLPAWIETIRRLRAARFDRVYDLQTSTRTAWYFRLMGSPWWSGVAAGCSHPHDTPGRIDMHSVDRQTEQLRIAGIAAVPPPDLAWLDADIGRFALPDRFALLVPGGSRHRPAKRWPAYPAFARALNSRGLIPVVAGTGDEAELARSVAAEVPGTVDLTGRTSILELAAIARRAALAIGNDTGPMHVTAAVGCPSLVLFSAESDPARCAPRGAVVYTLRRPDLADLPMTEVLNEATRLARPQHSVDPS